MSARMNIDIYPIIKLNHLFAMRKLTHHENVLRQEEKIRLPRIALTVVLNNVRSLYNVGSIFRTSDGLGESGQASGSVFLTAGLVAFLVAGLVALGAVGSATLVAGTLTCSAPRTDATTRSPRTTKPS